MNKKNKKLFMISIISVVLIILVISALFIFRSYRIKQQDKRDYIVASRLIASDDPRTGLAIVRKKNRHKKNTISEKWMALEISALAKLGNIPRLLYIFEKYPEAFSKNEEAALLISRPLLQSKKLGGFKKLRDGWRNHQTLVEDWFILDVDMLLIQEKKDEAEALLKSQTFEGEKDNGRLLRLSLISGSNDLAAAWDYLDTAYANDPKSADVRSFRAQILERIGKKNAARLEYVAAHLSDPLNPMLRDQLAEFYIRENKFELALETLSQGLETDSADFIWLKALFWSKVIKPIDFGWEDDKMPRGRLSPFVEYIKAFPKGVYWNPPEFLKILGAEDWLSQRQEFYWFRLIEMLRKGRENDALKLLQDDTFKGQLYMPELASHLVSILHFRSWGVILSSDPSIQSTSGNQGHQFFEQLALSSKKDADKKKVKAILSHLTPLLKSDDAFSSAFMAAGWLEAALQLQKQVLFPEDFPSWVAYGFTQAYRLNRGVDDAIAFALRQKKSPDLNLLLAELYLEKGEGKEGIERLASLMAEPDGIGFRAAWLMTLAHIESGELKKARAVLGQHKALGTHTIGKEMAARIALAEENFALAGKIYEEISAESIDARMYLAKRAFETRDYERAKALIEALLVHFPDNMELRSNLDQIYENEETTQ